jgi:hypothetical protein
MSRRVIAYHEHMLAVTRPAVGCIILFRCCLERMSKPVISHPVLPAKSYADRLDVLGRLLSLPGFKVDVAIKS